ncbi:hypothetical protein GW17_00044287 [Ensete ventricosum]|nr:hypothetical protein GW17_00044287 [Ensete ventricosum]
MVLLLYVFRCSGCTHEWNLDRPPVIEEATEFFKSLGVSDFTFESGRLVGVPSKVQRKRRGTGRKGSTGRIRKRNPITVESKVGNTEWYCLYWAVSSIGAVSTAISIVAAHYRAISTEGEGRRGRRKGIT